MKIEITEEQYQMAKSLLKQSMNGLIDERLEQFTSEIIGAYEWAKIEAEENEPNN